MMGLTAYQLQVEQLLTRAQHEGANLVLISEMECLLALMPLTEQPHRIRLGLKLGELYLHIGNTVCANLCATSQLRAAQQLNQPDPLIEALVLLSYIEEETDNIQTAQAHIGNALHVACRYKMAEVSIALLLRAGRLHLHAGHSSEAQNRFNEAVEMARLPDQRHLLPNALTYLAALMGSQDHEAASRYYEEALIAAREFGSRHYELHTLIGLGELAELNKRWPDARQYYECALAVAKEVNDPINISYLLSLLAELEHAL
jgi:tetratricopeptide (TPR) repeat protein